MEGADRGRGGGDVKLKAERVKKLLGITDENKTEGDDCPYCRNWPEGAWYGCRAKTAGEHGYWCSRHDGHDGLHVACGGPGRHGIRVWGKSPEDKTSTLVDVVVLLDWAAAIEEAARCVVANAVVGPDAAMDGATDCYHVPLEDVDALRRALEEGIEATE